MTSSCGSMPQAGLGQRAVRRIRSSSDNRRARSCSCCPAETTRAAVPCRDIRGNHGFHIVAHEAPTGSAIRRSSYGLSHSGMVACHEKSISGPPTTGNCLSRAQSTTRGRQYPNGSWIRSVRSSRCAVIAATPTELKSQAGHSSSNAVGGSSVTRTPNPASGTLDLLVAIGK